MFNYRISWQDVEESEEKMKLEENQFKASALQRPAGGN